MELLKKKKKTLSALQVSSVATIMAPLTTYTAINFNSLFSTTASAVSFSIGGILIVVFAILTALGKASVAIKANKSLWVFGIIFAMSILFEPIILNLKMISGMMLLGEGVNAIIFTKRINEIKEELQTMKTNANLQQVITTSLKESDIKSGRV